MDILIDIEAKEAVDIVHVSGRLTMSNIKQLMNVCVPMERNFMLDLSELIFVDDGGAEVIRGLLGNGAEFRGASTFIKLLIDG
jgi:hypothetical protein